VPVDVSVSDKLLLGIKSMDFKKKNNILLIVLALAAITMFFSIMIKMASG